MAIPERIDLLHSCPGVTAVSIPRGPHSPDSPYSGFNACHYVGDDPAHVDACRRDLAAMLGLTPDRLVIPRQTHSARVEIVTDPSAVLEGVDALVTDCPGIALCINTADCVPIVLADPVSGVIGAAHSGWRGTIASIAALTVEAMVSLGADPGRIQAAMGPCICGRCYCVGEDVARRFIDKYRESSDQVVRPFGQYHIDLPQAVRLTLLHAGLKPGHISLPTECSHHTPAERWPSARRLGIASPRTLTAILSYS